VKVGVGVEERLKRWVEELEVDNEDLKMKVEGHAELII
jgi:hypothetical protein